jgi:hypothetical protein
MYLMNSHINLSHHIEIVDNVIFITMKTMEAMCVEAWV